MTTELKIEHPVVLWAKTIAEHAGVTPMRVAVGDQVIVDLFSTEDWARIGRLLNEVVDNPLDIIIVFTRTQQLIYAPALGLEVCFRADVPGVGA